MLRATLLNPALSPAFKAQALLLPAESFIGEQRDMVDPEAIREARRYAMRVSSGGGWPQTGGQRIRRCRDVETGAEYSPDVESAGRRALRNLSLTYLAEGEAEGVLEIAREQLVASTNMTDAQGALAVIVNSASPLKAEALMQLARVWGDQPLLMNKWFQLQATAMAHPGEPPVVERVRLLMRHPGFSLSNPNNVNALIRSFCMLMKPNFTGVTRAVTRSGSSRCWRLTRSTRRSPRASRARSIAGANSLPIGRPRCGLRLNKSRAARSFARRVRDRQQIARR